MKRNFFTALFMCFAFILNAQEENTCGENLTWSMNTRTRILEISGSGDMYDYSDGEQPWLEYKARINTVNIGSGVTSIGDNAFKGFYKISEINLAEGLQSIGDNALSGAIIDTLALPATINNIGDYAFHNCRMLCAIALPENVSSIGKGTFKGCENLEKVVLNKNLSTIKEEAFDSCTVLQNVYCSATTPPVANESLFDFLPDNAILFILSGSGSAYRDANGWSRFSKIIEIDESEGSTGGTCGENAYWAYNASNGELHIQGSGEINDLSSSMEQPWYNIQDSIKAVIIDNGITRIGTYSFISCNAISSITIPESMESIGSNSLNGCSLITEIKLPEGLKRIEAGAFATCGISEIYIPASVTDIRHSIISLCDNLTTITVDAENEVYDSRENCNAINETATNTLVAGCKTTVIPNGIRKIGTYAFGHCTGLTELEIPEGVYTISEGAFNYCTNLTTIKLPSTLQSVGGYNTFSYGEYLKEVYVSNRIPAEIQYSLFSHANILQNAKLYVPRGCSDIYLQSGNWGNFSVIYEDEELTTIVDASFPIYSNKLEYISLPGYIKNDSYLWNSPVFKLDQPVKGIRITVFRTDINELHHGYPMFAMSELKFYNGNGDRLEIAAESINTNSLEISEGSLEYLSDDNFGTFYHSAWSMNENNINPDDYVYIEVTFPQPESSFSFLMNSRSGISKHVPMEIGVTPVGVECERSLPRTIYNGYCGSKATWELDTETGELVVDGAGDMYEYSVLSGGQIPTFSVFAPYVKNLTIEGEVTSVGQLSFMKYGIENLIITAPVKYINQRAFFGCNSLKSVVLPATLQGIGQYVFCDPNYGGGEQLESIYINATTPPVTNLSFNNDSTIFKNTTLYVPKNSIEAYRNSYEWQYFENILPIEETAIESIEGGKASVAMADGAIIVGGVYGLVELYSVDGRLLDKTVGNGGECTLSIGNAKGVAVLKVGEKAIKIVL